MISPNNIEAIIESYARGYFLMADEREGLGWYTSNQRTLIPLDERFRYPKSLRRSINQEYFTVKIDRDFTSVCRGCAARDTTWISEDLIEIYWALHRAGWAHSFETWQGERLAGGILGIVIGGVFIGESMFYNIPEGSKVAMVKLVQHLRDRGFVLFDAQLQNPHLERFGSYVIDNREYEILLDRAIRKKCQF
jgi:leucyl/phenylalanyl-tRNA--protein transferase